MGWTTSYSWQKLRNIISERTQNSTNQYGTKWELLAKCYRGAPYAGVLWTVWKVTKAEGTSLAYIGCDLIKYYGKNEGFGYKDMSADMHPFRYNCPISFILNDAILANGPDVNTKTYLEWVGGVLTHYKKNKESKNYKKALEKYPTAIKLYEDHVAEAKANPFNPKKMVTMEEMFPDGIPTPN